MATVRYDTLAAYVGPEIVSGDLASGDIKQLSRVQSTNYSIEITRENTAGLGSAFSNDNVKEAPFVNLNVEYLLTNGQNEKNLGLVVDGSHGALLDLNSGERDFFLLVKKPAEDPMVLAIGNGMLMKYEVRAAVGDFVRANVDIRGFNIKLDEGTSGNYIPRVNIQGLPNTTQTYQLPPYNADASEREVGKIADNIFVGKDQLVLRFPNNIAFGEILSGENSSHFQSFGLTLGVTRNELTRLGEKYPRKRCLQLPMDLTLSATLLLSNFAADNIQNYLCQNNGDFEIDIKDNHCETTDKFWETVEDTVRLKYIFKGMKMKSFQSADSIADRKTVTVEWSVPIGNVLDLNRNLFISGDFGRYLFPISSFQDISGEPVVTGLGLMPLVKEVVYRRSKPDIEIPEFNLEFSGDFDMHSGDAYYYVYYQGDSGVAWNGPFNTGISKTPYDWNSDSYATVFDGSQQLGHTEKFASFSPKYAIGYPALFDTPSGEYAFYVRGEGYDTDPIQITFGNLPSWLDAGVEYGNFEPSPFKPLFFNKLYLNINAVDVPSGTPFDIQMILHNSKFKKVYTIEGTTPYSFPISLPNTFSSRSSLWLNPYDETKVTRGVGNGVSNVQSSALRADNFISVSGSGSLPLYAYHLLNNKSYVHLDSGSYLHATGEWMQDFRNFTFFAVYRPSGSSVSGAPLLRFYQTDSGAINYTNEAFFGRKGVSQDLEFYYINPTGTSGFSGVKSSALQVTSTWDTENWNLATIIYDGQKATGHRSGVFVGEQTLAIGQSGSFNRVDIGSGYIGDIAEVILLPYKLLPFEILHVENLLKYKWGI